MTLFIMEHFEILGSTSINLVTQIANDDLFNHQLCIICQEDTKSSATSTDIWRESVKRAANIHNDVL